MTGVMCNCCNCCSGLLDIEAARRGNVQARIAKINVTTFRTAMWHKLQTKVQNAKTYNVTKGITVKG